MARNMAKLIWIKNKEQASDAARVFLCRKEAVPSEAPSYFRGEANETALTSEAGKTTAFVGLGERGGGSRVRDDWREITRAREAGAAAAKACKKAGAARCAINVREVLEEGEAAVEAAQGERDLRRAARLRAFAHGLLVGNYRFDLKRAMRGEAFDEDRTYFLYEEKEAQDGAPEAGRAETISAADAEAILTEAETLAEGTCFVRDMVNLPGNLLRPSELARRIISFLEGSGVEAETLSYVQLEKMGLNALCAVGGSSAYPPCMVVLRYEGKEESGGSTGCAGAAGDSRQSGSDYVDNAGVPSDSGSGRAGDAVVRPLYGLVGKGVTCDTGGYCLKSAGSMAGIKGDMAGAAAVAAAVRSAAVQKLPVRLVACLPLCENRISDGALLPGDVLTAYDGKTIEVLNTDAEGRLILADAISYAVRALGAARVLDIATLTGAAWGALGYTIGASMCDDDAYYASFEKALAESGERYVRLPFGPEHRKMIESAAADVKNTGANCCGTITAGVFLREFAGGRPWLHLDIAGTAWCEEPAYAFESKGATGAGMLSIYEWLKIGHK